LLLFSVLFSLAAGEGFLEPPPAIVVPLGNMMAVKAERHFFLLDYTEAIIYQYDLAGQQVKTFGGKGQGPGTFDQAHRLTWLGHRLYVHDFRSVQVYDEDGTFLERIKNPHEVWPRKVASGWLGLKGALTESELLLIYYREDYSRTEVIASWDVPAMPDQFSSNVIQYLDAMVVSKDGRWAFIKPRYSGDLWKFSVDKRELSLLALDLPPIPYDPEIGRERVRTLNERRKRLGRGSLRFDIPETYPPISTIHLTLDGNLAVKRHYQEDVVLSTRAAMNKGVLLFLDPNGRTIEPEIVALRPELVIASDASSVIHLRHFRDTGTTTLVRVAHSDAEKSLAKAWASQICMTCGAEILR